MQRGRPLSRRRFLKGVGAFATTGIVGPALAGAARDTGPGSAPGARIRFGVTANQAGSFQQIAALWEAAESLGFDSAFVFDHFMAEKPGAPAQERFQEAWTLLAGLAARTRRIGLGVLVNCCTYRHPAVVAKMASTVDDISGGRLILGMGAGWLKREHKAYGIQFSTKAGRAARLAESVDVIERLLSQERVSYDGRYFRLKDAPAEPKPARTLPILIGGSGPKLIQPVAARSADIWHFGLPSRDPEEIRRFLAGFDERCRQVGRDPAEVVKATSLFAPTDDKAAHETSVLARELVAAGIRYFILFPPPDNAREPLERMARDVIPTVRDETGLPRSG